MGTMHAVLTLLALMGLVLAVGLELHRERRQGRRL